MLYSVLMGGLGNQLFQVANGISLSIKHNMDIIFSYSDKKNYSDSIFKYIIQKKGQIQYPVKVYNEPEFIYNEIIIQDTDDTIILGLYQSDKYFSMYNDIIIDLFLRFKNETIIKNTLNCIYRDIHNDSKNISLHFRRGDYLQQQNIHPVLSSEYYINALKKLSELLNIDDTELRKEYVLIIFSDDLHWCKNLDFLKKYKCYFIDLDIPNINYNDLLELYLMSMCTHNIIANSSFSWWASYLNLHKTKKVIAPKKWFGVDGIKKHNIYTDFMTIM